MPNILIEKKAIDLSQILPDTATIGVDEQGRLYTIDGSVVSYVATFSNIPANMGTIEGAIYLKGVESLDDLRAIDTATQVPPRMFLTAIDGNLVVWQLAAQNLPESLTVVRPHDFTEDNPKVYISLLNAMDTDWKPALAAVKETADTALANAATAQTSADNANEAAATVQTNLTNHANNKANPHAVTKAQVGLGNVDNTSDKDKPVSTQTQEAIIETRDVLTNEIAAVEGKADTAQAAATAAQTTADTAKTTADTAKTAADKASGDAGTALSAANAAQSTAETAQTTAEQAQTTAEAASSTATQVSTGLNTHIADKTNPHAVTKAQVGLGNVDNTSDASKPVSTAQQTALDGKLDKTGGTISGYTLIQSNLDVNGSVTVGGQVQANTQVTTPIVQGGGNDSPYLELKSVDNSTASIRLNGEPDEAEVIITGTLFSGTPAQPLKIGSNVNLSNMKMSGVPTPTSSDEVANKNYVDAQVAQDKTQIVSGNSAVTVAEDSSGFGQLLLLNPNLTYTIKLDSTDVILGLQFIKSGSDQFIFLGSEDQTFGLMLDLQEDKITLKGAADFQGATKIRSQLDMSSQKIVSLAAPTDTTDAVNKQYADTKAEAIEAEDEATAQTLSAANPKNLYFVAEAS